LAQSWLLAENHIGRRTVLKIILDCFGFSGRTLLRPYKYIAGYLECGGLPPLFATIALKINNVDAHIPVHSPWQLKMYVELLPGVPL
jgi:hypothetical protein